MIKNVSNYRTSFSCGEISKFLLNFVYLVLVHISSHLFGSAVQIKPFPIQIKPFANLFNLRFKIIFSQNKFNLVRFNLLFKMFNLNCERFNLFNVFNVFQLALQKV